MQLINKHNYFSTVCKIFTILIIVKVILEYVTGREDAYYIDNILSMFVITLLATLVLGLHYYLQDLPLIPVIIGQYVILMAVIHGSMSASAHFFGTKYASNGYRDTFITFTIPYVVGATAYYVAFFRECKKANRIVMDWQCRMDAESGQGTVNRNREL